MKNIASRRTFLSTTAAAAAATLLPSTSVAAVTKAPMTKELPFHLGLCSYSLRTMTRAQVIAAMKQLKLTRLNCKDIKDHLPSTSVEAEQAAVADYKSNGIDVTAVGAVYFKDPKDFRKNFEYAKTAGVKVIVAGDPAPSDLPAIEKLVKEFDIKFAIHNHGPEDKTWPSPMTVLDAVQHMDPRMGCCIDIGHTSRAGTDIVAAIRRAGPRLFDLHTKDLAKGDVKESQVAVGEGILPIPEIFHALVAINYKGNVDLEYEINADNPLPGIIESFAYMKGVLAGMGYKSW